MGGGRTAQLAPNLGMGSEAAGEPGEEVWEEGLTGGQRKGVAAGREIRDLGASGEQVSPALTQQREGPE